jgi:DNA primase
MSVWDEIKARIAVEDIIAEYIPIIPSGQNFKCVCPFHQERTPSMVISPAKQIWHCFGCGAGGDVFKFVMEHENLTKSETLKKLAKKAGITLEEKAISQEKILEKFIEQNQFQNGQHLLDWSAKFYHTILLKLLQDRKNPITQYCLERGLTDEIIRQFQLGYAPKGNILKEYAKKLAMSLPLLEQVGLLKPETQHDKFKDRLLIPIFDSKDQVVGFTGRVLPHDTSDRPKYLNSSQSQWFNKSNLWYGLNFARKYILQEKHVTLVEGNMDVIAAFQAGIKTCIASQGTSFTSSQLAILKRFTSVIHLAFDNDNAGTIAGKKLFIEATKIGFIVEKLIIPKKFKDLDEYSHSDGFELSKIERVAFLDYILTLNNSLLTSVESSVQKTAILETLDLFVYLGPIETEQYLQKLNHLTNISTSTLESLLKEKRAKAPQQSNQTNEEFDQQQKTHSMFKNQQSAPIYLTFQQLTALTGEQKLANYFMILKEILPQLTTFSSLEDYKTESESEFDLIRSEKHQPGEGDISLMNKTLMSYIDQNISSISLNPEIQEIYMKLKMG